MDAPASRDAGASQAAFPRKAWERWVIVRKQLPLTKMRVNQRGSYYFRQLQISLCHLTKTHLFSVNFI